MTNLIDELATEIFASNPDYSSKDVTNHIVSLIEDDILPSAIDRVRLPRTPSPIELRIDYFKRERRRGKKDADELQSKVDFVRELERLKPSFYFSDFTSEGGLQVVDVRDVSQRPSVSPTGYKERAGALSETEITLPKTESKSLSDLSERKPKAVSEFITIDPSLSKKIFSDPHFEKAIAGVECRLRGKFRDVPDISFNILLRQDVDDTSRERTIISVKIPNSSFKEKMNSWLRIDLEVRKAIRASDLAEEERKTINRNLVTHVESD